MSSGEEQGSDCCHLQHFKNTYIINTEAIAQFGMPTKANSTLLISSILKQSFLCELFTVVFLSENSEACQIHLVNPVYSPRHCSSGAYKPLHMKTLNDVNMQILHCMQENDYAIILNTSQHYNVGVMTSFP